MFMSTLTGPFHNHLLGNSSAGFTELILTVEHVKNGIRSGKIQVAISSNTAEKSYNGKKESNDVYDHKGRSKSDHDQSVGEILISNPAPVQQQQNNQRRQDAPRR